jgi:ATP-dependent exoDNAse (exonuclease V) alpha subunit
MTQQEALEILKSGANVFLTGSAGTGKTFLLNQFISYLKKENIPVGITASTGIAATHIGGLTIHSWSGIGIKDWISEKEMKKVLRNKQRREKIKAAKVLIIDEISMLDAGRLDLLNEVCRLIKEPFLPFGGLQVVMCGDFFQLPPVDLEKEALFAYEASSWKQADIKVCYLDKQYRQSDAAFCGILNKIRNNEAGQEEMTLLRTRIMAGLDGFIHPVKLYTHNIDVDAINDRELDKIAGEQKNYSMYARGPKDLVATLKKGCLAKESLGLKIGAAVMFIKNNFEEGYVNGTLGVVVGFNSESMPIVKTKDGKEITVKPAVWVVEGNEKVVASISQLPLRLAWAITVHKSQGMSLDAAEMDLSKSFERGMGYVALSRVRELSGVRLLGINELSLKVSEKVAAKDLEFKKLSDNN